MLKMPGEIKLVGGQIHLKVHAQLWLDKWLHCAL